MKCEELRECKKLRDLYYLLHSLPENEPLTPSKLIDLFDQVEVEAEAEDGVLEDHYKYGSDD